jgi:integrase
VGSAVFPTGKRRQRLFASQQQIQRIIAAAKEPYRTFYGLAAETGLRPGELCGLTVDDLNLEQGILQVRQSSWRGQRGALRANIRETGLVLLINEQ